MAKEKQNTSPAEKAAAKVYGSIASYIDKQQLKIEDPALRLDVSLNLIASLSAQIISACLSAASENPASAGRIMYEAGDLIGQAIKSGYRKGTATGCPCGECGPVEVEVIIRPILPSATLDSTPPPKGTRLS